MFLLIQVQSRVGCVPSAASGGPETLPGTAWHPGRGLWLVRACFLLAAPPGGLRLSGACPAPPPSLCGPLNWLRRRWQSGGGSRQKREQPQLGFREGAVAAAARRAPELSRSSRTEGVESVPAALSHRRTRLPGLGSTVGNNLKAGLRGGTELGMLWRGSMCMNS